MDFSAIFLLRDSLFWLVEQTTPYLSHRSCLYKESSVCSVAPAVYCAIPPFDFAHSFSLCCACFSHYVKLDESIESLGSTFSIGRHVKGSHSQSPLLSLSR